MNHTRLMKGFPGPNIHKHHTFQEQGPMEIFMENLSSQWQWVLFTLCWVFVSACFKAVSCFFVFSESHCFSEASSFNNWHKLLSMCPAICPCPVNTICVYMMCALIHCNCPDGAHLLDFFDLFLSYDHCHIHIKGLRIKI